MRYCILIFSFLQLSLSYGQDLQNLDRKFGIKKFRLESSITLYKSQIQLLRKNDNGTSYYKYLGKDINNLFNVSIEEVGLIFYKNILYSISITFAQTSETNEKIVYSKLKDLFGDPFTGTGKEKAPLDYEWDIFGILKRLICNIRNIV